jgi:hypothetical protein
MSELTNFEKIRKLRWQLAGNAFNTISCATNFYGGSMFILFLNELQLDTARIGFLLSLLPFFGITSLLTAPYIARIGFKRTFVGYAFVRLVFVAMLLSAPMILRVFGPQAAFMMVASATACFSLAKAFGETAMTPWQQELIPDMIRGKFGALTAIIQLTVNAAAIFVGGWVIGQMTGLTPYMILISAGLVVGVISAWCYSFMPGGAPIRENHGNTAHFKQMYEAVIKDRNYGKYIFGMMLVFVGFCVATTFVSLFMKNEVGLSSTIVIWLDIASFLGGIASSYLWGWAADRYGSKPVMLMGPLTMMLFPIVCFFMPRHSSLSIVPAMLVPFIYGAAGMAWSLGLGRYLYVTAMPPEKKTAYTAVYYACLNLAAAIGIAASGMLLKLTSGIRGSFLGFPIDPYTPIFAIGMIITLAGVAVISTLRRGDDMPILQFMSMFIKGNPLTAFWALLKHKYAKNEHTRVRVIHQLGHSRSPLNDRELIESLQDPCFNVCVDAIMAIALRKPEPELVKALEQVVQSQRSQTSVTAAWAIGRMEATAAIPTLRNTLAAGDSALRCASARALATLGDIQSIERVAQLLRQEKDIEVQVAYAFALGRLKAKIYSTELLRIMISCKEARLRQEAVLAVAMLTGEEGDYVALWRRLHADYATGAAQSLWALKKSFEKIGLDNSTISLLETTAAAFAQNNISEGTVHLKNLLTTLRPLCDDPVISEILAQCISQMTNANISEKEYVLLAIHTLGAMLLNGRIKTSQTM